MKPEERIKNVQHALNNYFDSEPAPTPSEAKAFLLKLRQDIDIMLVVIDTMPGHVRERQ